MIPAIHKYQYALEVIKRLEEAIVACDLSRSRAEEVRTVQRILAIQNRFW